MRIDPLLSTAPVSSDGNNCPMMGSYILLMWAYIEVIDEKSVRGAALPNSIILAILPLWPGIAPNENLQVVGSKEYASVRVLNMVRLGVRLWISLIPITYIETLIVVVDSMKISIAPRSGSMK